MNNRFRVLVFGMMADKKVAEVAARLFPLFDRVIATEPYPPRSIGADRIVALADAIGIPAVAIPEPAEALHAALAGAERSVFVGGSLYLAGAAVAFFDSRAI